MTVEPIVVPPWFSKEFPGARRAATEVAANAVRTVDAFLAEVDRRRRKVADLSASAFQCLSILDGADGPLEPKDIAASLLVTSASMTSLLDTLERRGLIRRAPHPRDRRKVLVSITPRARGIVDRMLPIVHATASSVFGDLTDTECTEIVRALTIARTRLAELATEPHPSRPPARRKGVRRELRTEARGG